MATGLQARELPFDLDLGLFRAAGNRSRLEVYLGIDRRQITYERERGRYAAHMAGVVLLKQRGQIIDFREMAIEDVVDHLDDGPHGVIPKQATFSLEPGSYDLLVVVEDGQGNRSDSTLRVEVPAYGGLELEISTIQLASVIRRSAGWKEFYKRGLTVWPNAGAVYDDDRPLLWHYAEVYGLTPLDTVEVRTLVWRDSTEVISQAPRRAPSPSLVFCDWGAVNLSALAAGDYCLTITVSMDGDTASAMKPFRVVREAPAAVDSGDVLAALSTAELTDFARGLSLLQPELDIQAFRSLDSAGKRRIIGDAGGKVARGLSQDSSLNLGELLHRWGHVKAYDRDWRGRSRLTEQGRTMFLYGPPATIETYPATSALREHQVWTFTYPDSTDPPVPDKPSGPDGLSGTGQFVFMDREGYGEFMLVHATVLGAVRNENWRRELSWVPVPVSTVAPPAPEVEEEGKAPTPVDTAQVEPVIVDTMAAPVDTALAEPALVDTLVAPGPEMDADTTAVDSAAVELVPPDTTAVDTTAADTLLLEPALIDTIRTP